MVICCSQSKRTRISSRKQDDFVGLWSIRSSTSGRWLEKSGKHVCPNFTLKPSTKASSPQFGEQKYKQILVARKKETSERYMAYSLTQETSAAEQFKSSRWKKGRQERRGDRGFNEVMFDFCLPRRYSLVFIDEGHQ